MSRCDTCRFFSATLSKYSALKIQEGTGECRRYAPRGPFMMGTFDGNKTLSGIVSPFVPVCVDDWCGEWTPLPEDK